MTTYILIHGSWHGAWCWNKVRPLLEKEGHQVIAPDLPAHGQDQTPLVEVTLQSYAKRIVEVLDAQPEPAILVGHSMGGVAITQAAEYRPHRISHLVYLAAFLPRDGESLLQLALQDTDSLVLPNLIVAEEEGYTTVKEEGIRPAFYGDCSDEDVKYAVPRLVLDPLAPVATPVEVSDDRFGRIPRTYITCLRDRAVSPDLQRRMYLASPCEQVLSLETSHSPFFSAPEALAAYLITLAERQGQMA